MSYTIKYQPSFIERLWDKHKTVDGNYDVISGYSDFQSVMLEGMIEFAYWCIDNGISEYYNEDDVEQYIDHSKRLYLDMEAVYIKFINEKQNEKSYC